MRWSKAPAAVASARAAAFLLVMSSGGHARAASEYVILGAGSRPCGSWLQVRSQALPDTAVLQSWVLGYISSVNANLLTSSPDVTAGASPDALFSWIDNYCAAHPLDSVARAARTLLDSFLAKGKAK
jgi:hypothetical protein